MRTTGSKLNYATTLFDYIRRAMPFNAPKTLTHDEVYALTAYVLNLSDILPADAVLDRASIVAVKMPNRDGFTTQHGLMRVDGKPDTHATRLHDGLRGERCGCLREIPEYARDSHGDLAEQTRRLADAGHAIAAASASSPPAGPAPAEMATRAGCMTCHGVDKAGRRTRLRKRGAPLSR